MRPSEEVTARLADWLRSEITAHQESSDRAAAEERLCAVSLAQDEWIRTQPGFETYPQDDRVLRDTVRRRVAAAAQCAYAACAIAFLQRFLDLLADSEAAGDR